MKATAACATIASVCFPGKQAMNRYGIGRPVRRVEDARFLTGSARFVADVDLPRQCYGVAVLSPHAHACVRAVDASAEIAKLLAQPKFAEQFITRVGVEIDSNTGASPESFAAFLRKDRERTARLIDMAGIPKQ